MAAYYNTLRRYVEEMSPLGLYDLRCIANNFAEDLNSKNIVKLSKSIKYTGKQAIIIKDSYKDLLSIIKNKKISEYQVTGNPPSLEALKYKGMNELILDEAKKNLYSRY